MSEKKAVIKNADMSDEMQQDAVDCAMQAMEKYNIEKDIAAYVKKVRLQPNLNMCLLWWCYIMCHLTWNSSFKPAIH